jgi:hypothetical protein
MISSRSVIRFGISLVARFPSRKSLRCIAPLKILADGIFNWWSGTADGPLCCRDWRGRWSTYHFCLPLLLPRFQEVGAYFPHASARGCGCARADSVWGSGAAARGRCRRGYRSGLATRKARDLLPLACIGIFVGAPPAQDPFSLLLFSIQGLEPWSRIGYAPLGGSVSC